jgi:hypothetical protein
MIEKLLLVEQDLPSLLKTANWQSLYVTYEKPYVERMWCAWGDYRVNLHKIHPCDEGESFFHPHPWPSAIKIIDGIYQMEIGYGEGIIAPSRVGVTCWLGPGSYYEMTDINSWHSVRPIKNPVISIMLTGKPWGREMPSGDHIKLSSLSESKEQEILSFFRDRYV